MSMFRRRLMIANALGKSDGNINYPGLIAAWSAKGKTNDDKDRAILRDLTGNGHDITLYNFAFSEMSGYGGYSTKALSTWRTFPQHNTYENINLNTVKITIGTSREFLIYINIPSNTFDDKYIYIRTDISNADLFMNSGITEQIDEYNWKFTYDNSNTDPNRRIGSKKQDLVSGKTITLELLPEYPDALVFDGVDDYGVNDNMPIISDYTLIVEREILDDFTNRGMVACYTGNPIGDKGPFWFEYGFTPTNITTYSFGKYTLIKDILNKNRFISYQTKSKYNGKDILFDDSLISGNKIVIGGFYGYRSLDINMVFYSAYLFDRSLDEQEIKSFIRKYIDADYILPSEQEN